MLQKLYESYLITSVEKLSFDEFLKANGFKADSDESNIVGLEEGLEGRDLSARQPTERSPESPQEYDDTPLLCP